MKQRENQENDKSIDEKGKELIEVLKNSKCKVFSVSIKSRKGKTFVIKDNPLLFKIIEVEKKEVEKKEDINKNISVCFSAKNKHNTILLMIKFWNTDLFLSLYNSGFKFGYNSYTELPKFYVIIPLDKIKDFKSWNLEGQKLVENY